MTTEENTVDIQRNGSHERHGETLLCDYAKYLTTIVLLALCGVLSIGRSDAFKAASPQQLVMVVGLVGFGGAMSLHTAMTIALKRAAGEAPPPHRTRIHIWLDVAGIGLGLGAFLAIFWEVFL